MKYVWPSYYVFPPAAKAPGQSWPSSGQEGPLGGVSEELEKKSSSGKSFACLGPACPSSCCAGMEIEIDEDSLKGYREVEGPLGEWLKEEIDWEEGSFYQSEEGCCMLTSQGLCSIWLELGEEALCETCRLYPRHEEIFPGVREFSLGLSCPAAVYLTCEAPYGAELIEAETSFSDEEVYEEEERRLFAVLEKARERLWPFMESQGPSWREKEGALEALASCLQEGYDQGEDLFDVLACQEIPSPRREEFLPRWRGEEERKKEEHLLHSLWHHKGPLPGWGRGLALWNGLSSEEKDERMKAFSLFCSSWTEGDFTYERAMTHLGSYYFYVFWPGACYTGEILSCSRLGRLVLCWQEELLLSRFTEKGEITKEDFYEVAAAFSRLLEHDTPFLEKVLRFLAG